MGGTVALLFALGMALFINWVIDINLKNIDKQKQGQKNQENQSSN